MHDDLVQQARVAVRVPEGDRPRPVHLMDEGLDLAAHPDEHFRNQDPGPAYEPPAAQGERCGSPACLGQSGEHPEVITVNGVTLKSEQHFFGLGVRNGIPDEEREWP